MYKCVYECMSYCSSPPITCTCMFQDLHLLSNYATMPACYGILFTPFWDPVPGHVLSINYPQWNYTCAASLHPSHICIAS